jgi:hypothetical protein
VGKLFFLDRAAAYVGGFSDDTIHRDLRLPSAAVLAAAPRAKYSPHVKGTRPIWEIGASLLMSKGRFSVRLEK